MLLPNNDRYYTLGSESSESNSPVPPTLPTFPAAIPLNEFSAPLLNERNPDSTYFQDINLGSPYRFTPTPPSTGPSTACYQRGYSTFKPSPPPPPPRATEGTKSPELEVEQSQATLEVETML